MLKNTTIKSRLIFVLVFLCAQITIGAVVGITSLGKANQAVHTLYDDRLVALGQLDHVLRLQVANQMLLASAVTADPAEVPKNIATVESNIAQITKVWGEYMATYLTPDEKSLAEKFMADRKKFVAEGLTPTLAALKAGDTKKATELVQGPVKALYAPLLTEGSALVDLQLNVGKLEIDATQKSYNTINVAYTSGALLGLLMATVIGVWLVRSITRPLATAVDIANNIAAGDLTQDIASNTTNETGKLLQSLRNMNEKLVAIVGEVRMGTSMIATASSQIAAGNMDLSGRTEEQASSLEETAASMEELTSTVKQNAENANQANTLAVSAAQIAVKGGDIVKQVITTMASIDASSKKITDIISVIDGIAFQTNILALNAAVEAARAGEQGRGFAVVATEVRNLAQRSAAAAKEIKVLINDSVSKVDTGSKLVSQAGETMAEMVTSVGRVTDIMDEITTATQEQSAGIEQVNQAIATMDQVTQQNAALVEEAAAAAQSLQEQAGTLDGVVGVFKMNGGFSTSQPAAARVPVSAPSRAASATSTQPPRTKPAVATSTLRRPNLAKKEVDSEQWEEF